MAIKKDTTLDKGKTYWYDFQVENNEKLNKIVLYLTTMSEHFSINVKKIEDEEYKFIGYIITELKISEEKIEKWYDEIEGGENNMH